MDAAIPFFAGAFMKIVDEIEDVNILNLQEYKQYFYTLCTLFITLWMYNDPYISISCICVIPACYYVKQIDNNYWKSLMIIQFITLLLKINSLEWLGLNDIIYRIIFILAFVIGIYIEAKLTPEETSIRKIFVRSLSILIVSSLIYFTSDFSSAVFIKTICMYVIGYCLISVLSMSFFTNTIEAESKSDSLSGLQEESKQS